MAMHAKSFGLEIAKAALRLLTPKLDEHAFIPGQKYFFCAERAFACRNRF
jgi:hypothetical protein